MSASNLVEAGNRILEAQGKKARQSLQRKPSGQIYRVPIIRMVKVLQKIFKGMDTTTATNIMNDYVASAETNF